MTHTKAEDVVLAILLVLWFIGLAGCVVFGFWCIWGLTPFVLKALFSSMFICIITGLWINTF